MPDNKNIDALRAEVKDILSRLPGLMDDMSKLEREKDIKAKAKLGLEMNFSGAGSAGNSSGNNGDNRSIEQEVDKLKEFLLSGMVATSVNEQCRRGDDGIYFTIVEIGKNRKFGMEYAKVDIEIRNLLEENGEHLHQKTVKSFNDLFDKIKDSVDKGVEERMQKIAEIDSRPEERQPEPPIESSGSGRLPRVRE